MVKRHRCYDKITHFFVLHFVRFPKSNLTQKEKTGHTQSEGDVVVNGYNRYFCRVITKIDTAFFSVRHSRYMSTKCNLTNLNANGLNLQIINEINN